MLFKTTNEFAEYVAVNASLTFDLLKNHIRTAEERWLKPILGATLYAQLQADYDAESTNPVHLALLDRSRRAVGPLSFSLYAPFSQVQMSDAGWRTVQDDNHRAAFRWQVEKIEEASELQGMMALEELLVFLEENDNDYPDWDYANNHKDIINTVHEFEESVAIDSSRLIFVKLRPALVRAQKNLKGVMGKPQLDDLLLNISTGTLSQEYEALVEYCQPVVAHTAFAKAIMGLPVKFDGKLIRVFASQFPGGSDFPPKVQADDAKLSYLSKYHAQMADQALEELRDFLYENAPDFPLFMESPAYTATGSIDETDTSRGGFFFV